MLKKVLTLLKNGDKIVASSRVEKSEFQKKNNMLLT